MEASVSNLEIDEGESFVVTAGMMDRIKDNRVNNKDNYLAMIDSGANVNLGPKWLANALGLIIVPHKDARKIGTAKSSDALDIYWDGSFLTV